MKNTAVVVLIVGLAGLVVSAFGALWAPLTFIGAAIAAAALIWQYTSTRVVELQVHASDWNAPSTGSNGLFSYVIPSETARRRRSVVPLRTIDGELQEVFYDEIFASDGSIEIRSGSADDVTIRLS